MVDQADPTDVVARLARMRERIAADDLHETIEEIEQGETALSFENWKRMDIRLEGATELLMHKAEGNLGGGGTVSGKQKVRPTAAEEAPRYEYRNGEGHLFVPAINVRQAVVQAGKKFPVPKRRFSFDTILRGALQLDPNSLECGLYRAGTPITTWALDARRVVIGKAGVERGRPKIELPWQLRGSLLIDLQSISDDEAIVLEQMRRILATCGTMVGLLDFRPGSGGWFGTFRVASLAFRDLETGA